MIDKKVRHSDFLGKVSTTFPLFRGVPPLTPIHF